MNCAVCKRPLFDGATACIVCGAPVAPPPPLATAPTVFAPRPAPPAAPGYGYGSSPPQTPPVYDAYAPSGRPLPGYAPPAAYPPPAQYYGAPVVADRNNSLALAAFICGVLGLVPFWIGFVLCILAIVLGSFAIQHANRLPDRRGKGLAIAGLVLGIVFLLPASCGL